MNRADGNCHSMMAAIRLRKSGVNGRTISKAASSSPQPRPRLQMASFLTQAGHLLIFAAAGAAERISRSLGVARRHFKGAFIRGDVLETAILDSLLAGRARMIQGESSRLPLHDLRFNTHARKK